VTSHPALPTISDLVAMTPAERLALRMQLNTLADQVAQVRGALDTLLYEPPTPAPLLDAKEVARRLNVSVDTVRAKGAEWDIEVYLADGICRYDPGRVEALRQQRRSRSEDPIRARLAKLA
jgi:hypothetical protein